MSADARAVNAAWLLSQVASPRGPVGGPRPRCPDCGAETIADFVFDSPGRVGPEIKVRCAMGGDVFLTGPAWSECHSVELRCVKCEYHVAASREADRADA